MMNQTQLYDFYLFKKEQADKLVLKELIQLLRTQNPGRTLNFTYIEPSTSLLPNLTLWENIHLAIGGSSWNDYLGTLTKDWVHLTNLINSPHKLAKKAEPWEIFIIELLKGISTESRNLLIDMNEYRFSQINLENIKKIVIKANQFKPIYLATMNTDYWVENSHGIISKIGHEFKIDKFEQDLPKKAIG